MDGRLLESMQVSRAVIAKSSSKNQSQLYGPWLESTQKTFDIECEHVRGMELWMRVLHETMTEDMYEVAIEVVWHAMERSYSPLRLFSHCEQTVSDFARLSYLLLYWPDCPNHGPLNGLDSLIFAIESNAESGNPKQ